MGSVAAFEQSHVIASVGKEKELSCTTQKLNPSEQPWWYRATNVDARRCPNQTFKVHVDSRSVFCDRLVINRIVQRGFVQKFSATPLGSENENGLKITRVELSDAGTYACVSYIRNNYNNILARINFTVEEG